MLFVISRVFAALNSSAILFLNLLKSSPRLLLHRLNRLNFLYRPLSHRLIFAHILYLFCNSDLLMVIYYTFLFPRCVFSAYTFRFLCLSLLPLLFYYKALRYSCLHNSQRQLRLPFQYDSLSHIQK